MNEARKGYLSESDVDGLRIGDKVFLTDAWDVFQVVGTAIDNRRLFLKRASAIGKVGLRDISKHDLILIGRKVNAGN